MLVCVPICPVLQHTISYSAAHAWKTCCRICCVFSKMSRLLNTYHCFLWTLI